MQEHKYIGLTKGKVAIVDAEDYERINARKWYARTFRNVWYASANGPKVKGKRLCTLHMHHFVLAPQEGMVTDHINGNGLDNRRSNLRLVTKFENAWNKKVSSRNKTGLKGISYRKDRNYWVAKITVNRQTIRLGAFKLAEEAHKAYMEKAKELHGEFFRA